MSLPNHLVEELWRQYQLEDMPAEHREALLARLRPFRLKAGKFLGQEGETVPNRLICILRGRVRLLKKNRFDDSRIVLGVFGPGAIIGDPWEDLQEPIVASAQAMEDLEGFLLEASDFEELIELHPKLGIRMLKRLYQVYMRRRRHMLERLAGFY